MTPIDLSEGVKYYTSTVSKQRVTEMITRNSGNYQDFIITAKNSLGVIVQSLAATEESAGAVARGLNAIGSTEITVRKWCAEAEEYSEYFWDSLGV